MTFTPAVIVCKKYVLFTLVKSCGQWRGVGVHTHTITGLIALHPPEVTIHGPAIHTADAPQRQLSADTLLAPVAASWVEIGTVAHGSKFLLFWACRNI